MRKEVLLTLAEYNHWANKQLLRKAARLSHEVLWKPNWLSRGTVIATLLHIADTQNAWRVTAQTGLMPPDEPKPEDYPDIPSLRKFWEVDDEELVAYIRSLKNSQLNQEVEYSWPRARPRRKVLWHILYHFLNHGTHHRAEVGQYLASIGHPVGDLDFLDYVSKATKK